MEMWRRAPVRVSAAYRGGMLGRRRASAEFRLAVAVNVAGVGVACHPGDGRQAL